MYNKLLSMTDSWITSSLVLLRIGGRETMKQYNITFRGYRRDIDRDMLPTFSGIYLVYCYSEHGAGKEATLNRIIYVGKAFNIRDEICDEKLHKKFERELQDGEELCYSYSSVSPFEKDAVENALAYMQKPVLNGKLKESYNFDNSEFHLEGACGLLKMTRFSIQSYKKVETWMTAL